MFNTRDDLTTLMVVSRSLVASCSFPSVCLTLKRDLSPINTLGTVGCRGRRQQLPAHIELPIDKSRKAPLNAIFILFYYMFKCHGLAGDEEGMCPPAWLLALGGKDGYDG